MSIDGLELIHEAVSEEYAEHILALLPPELLVPSIPHPSDVCATKTAGTDGERNTGSIDDFSDTGGISATHGASLQLHSFSPLPDVITIISEDAIPTVWKERHWGPHKECSASIVQRYVPGEGIRWHVDLQKFGDGVAILSLLSQVVMHFRPCRPPHRRSHGRAHDEGFKHPKQMKGSAPAAAVEEEEEEEEEERGEMNQEEAEVVKVHLPKRSLLLCSGSARYEWEHSIPSVHGDTIDGRTVPRCDRVSITMRRLVET